MSRSISAATAARRRPARRPTRAASRAGQARPLPLPGLFQSRQRRGLDPRHHAPGQPGDRSDLPPVDGAVPRSRRDACVVALDRIDGPCLVRPGRPARLPVHPGPARLRAEDAPHQHGLLRKPAAGRHAPQLGDHGGLRHAGGEPSGQAAAQGRARRSRRARRRHRRPLRPPVRRPELRRPSSFLCFFLSADRVRKCRRRGAGARPRTVGQEGPADRRRKTPCDS